MNDRAPSAFTYAAGTATYILNTPITENDPTNMGGAVTLYSVSPSLPTGLSLSTTTGDISGTPTALSVQTKYTVTATNSGGHATAVVFITVNSATPAPPGCAGGTGLPNRQCNLHSGRSNPGQRANQHRWSTASVHRSERESDTGL